MPFAHGHGGVPGSHGQAITILKNGTTVPACALSTGEASPNPCSNAPVLGPEGVSIRVLSSSAGTWTFRSGGSGIVDRDWDLVLDNYDNCLTAANPGQENNDHDAQGDACDPDDDNDGLTDADEAARGTDPFAADTDRDGLSDFAEVMTCHTNPLSWDSDGDRLPDGFEAANLDHPLALDPANALDAAADFDGDGNSNVHEYWNGSDPWRMDPVPAAGYEVGCYYWGKSDGGPFVGPGDIGRIQRAYVGGSLDYSRVLPSSFDVMDLDRDATPSPGDITLCQYMYVGADRPSGYPSSPAALSVEDAPGSAIAIGDTTHVTVSVHAQGPGSELYSPGMGVVFWVTSGNAVLLGGEGTDPGEAVGNRYDVSMEAASGALANIVVLVTGTGPVTMNAKIPGCGVEPVGRWCGEVELPAAAVINQ